ncbi:hypothetical protein COO91_01609 [Nostoc flagelliforme CCNUN1]|uniref:Uncharacterized protein n=1 Tax=Nostoc flagelliforme CCNUN1 TaxID=2038116 RepID=A0A2K8SJT4_9NOSO|nr:hypothetical protein COO91_01609 [Nostoc flagelliforme CCNUN1]
MILIELPIVKSPLQSKQLRFCSPLRLWGVVGGSSLWLIERT